MAQVLSGSCLSGCPRDTCGFWQLKRVVFQVLGPRPSIWFATFRWCSAGFSRQFASLFTFFKVFHSSTGLWNLKTLPGTTINESMRRFVDVFILQVQEQLCSDGLKFFRWHACAAWVSDVQIDVFQENQLFWSSLMIFCLAQVIGWVLKVWFWLGDNRPSD